MSDKDSKVVSWHVLSSDEVMTHLGTQDSGLTQDQVADGLRRFGANRLRPAKRKTSLQRFLEQFHNLLIYVLLLSGGITALLGHWIDSAVIFGVVVINALIGYIQEGKAEKALDAISQMLSQQAMVKRDGYFVTQPADTLVPGDVVLIQSGDKVPADLRLFKNHELRIEEAMLTGESLPAEKHCEAVALDAAVGDRRCMAFSGTLVSSGQGHGVVVATGDRTEIGRISGMLSRVHKLTTPLLRQMSQFSRWLTMAIALIALLTFVFGHFVYQFPLEQMFMAAVGLAVAGIPEGLPAIMTITLAIGVQCMARKNAIIRRLPAVETLGAVTVICSDKTGTLTKNEMTVQTVVTSAGVCRVSGSGYDPHGSFCLQQQDVSCEELPVLKEIARAALLCNDATLIEKADQWQMHGDPTEGALLTLAHKAGLLQEHEQKQYPRIDEIPFESQHRFMATLHHDHSGHGFIYLKGAPERVLTMCHRQWVQGEDMSLDLSYWEMQMAQMAASGQRLLALAFKPVDVGVQALSFNEVGSGLTLLGIVGIIDPPRDDATAAVQSCRDAGIQVKMITGDHGITASAIGLQMGIGDGRAVMIGNQLEKLSQEALQRAAAECDIFARVSPEQKLHLVEALQANGEVVVMTGDGVNDAPALKRADVGVAMGNKGTEVAKEAAEMVLTDDNFASIAHAVREGRTVYDNLKKSILFILPTNGGQMLCIIAAIMLGRLLPITPAQILWVNMITAVTLALTLAFEPAERHVMKRPPRDPKEPILSGFLCWRILLVSFILAAGTFGLFLWERENGASIELARTIAVNTLLLFEAFYLFSVRYLFAPSLTRSGIFGNRYVLYAIVLLLLIQMVFTYFPPMQTLFATTAMSWAEWGRVILVASTVLLLVEFEKMLWRYFKRH